MAKSSQRKKNKKKINMTSTKLQYTQKQYLELGFKADTVPSFMQGKKFQKIKINKTLSTKLQITITWTKNKIKLDFKQIHVPIKQSKFNNNGEQL